MCIGMIISKTLFESDGESHHVHARKTLLLSLAGTILHKGMISPQIVQAYAG